MLITHSKRRQDKEYYEGQKVYEKLIGERNKLRLRYKKQKVKKDLGKRVEINGRNGIVHKDNIKS